MLTSLFLSELFLMYLLKFKINPGDNIEMHNIAETFLIVVQFQKLGSILKNSSRYIIIHEGVPSAMIIIKILL